MKSAMKKAEASISRGGRPLYVEGSNTWTWYLNDEQTSGRKFQAERTVSTKPQRLGKAWGVPRTKWQPVRLQQRDGKNSRGNASPTGRNSEFQLWATNTYLLLPPSFCGQGRPEVEQLRPEIEQLLSCWQKMHEAGDLRSSGDRRPWALEDMVGGQWETWVSQGQQEDSSTSPHKDTLWGVRVGTSVSLWQNFRVSCLVRGKSSAFCLPILSVKFQISTLDKTENSRNYKVISL